MVSSRLTSRRSKIDNCDEVELKVDEITVEEGRPAKCILETTAMPGDQAAKPNYKIPVSLSGHRAWDASTISKPIGHRIVVELCPCPFF